MNRLSLLLFNIVPDHCVRQISRAHRKVSSHPQMPTPKLFPQMRKLLKQYPRTDPFQPLDDQIHIHVRFIGYQHVNVIAGHLPRQNRDLVLHRDLPNQGAHTKRHLPRQHLLPIFRVQTRWTFKSCFVYAAHLVPFHATTLHDPVLRLQGEGFHHPRWGH